MKTTLIILTAVALSSCADFTTTASASYVHAETGVVTSVIVTKPRDPQVILAQK